MERALLEGPRVLAARVEVEGEPSLAWPAPGEDARMSFLVAQPGEVAQASWALTACEAEPVVRGAPKCAARPFANAVIEDPTSEQPEFTFALPREGELLGTKELLILGAFCFDSETRVPLNVDDFAGYRCSGGREPNLVAMNVGVARDGEVNHNPELAATALSFDGELWPTVQVDTSLFHGCAEAPAALPLVHAGSRAHAITLSVPVVQREPLEPESSRAQSRETFQLSHVVSAGELERPFSVIDDQASEPEISVLWDAPSRVPEEGLVVRFFFVARDLRGGEDFTTTAVCVEPD